MLAFIFEHIMVQEILCTRNKLVLSMYNAHPYFSPQKCGQKSVHYTWQNTIPLPNPPYCFILASVMVSSHLP